MSTVPQGGRRSQPGRLIASLVALAVAALVTLWQGRTPAPAAPTPGAAVERRTLDDLPRAQIDQIVDSMARTGKPPPGIAQGGRHGGARGVFENAEGRLPGRPRGYYVETDVWPRGPDGRGAERLVFGRAGEVWYSPDHYRSFERVR